MRDEIISVVGGSGFLGRYVVKRLAEAGFRVRVLCRQPKFAEDLKPSGNVGQIVPDHLDLAKPDMIRRKLEGSYGVVNLVGLLYESGSQRFTRIHAQGAEKLAQEARHVGAEVFVQVSALGVDQAQHSTYARTKLEGERAVQAAFPQATILRPSVIYGAEDHFFNMFDRMASLSPALPAIGGGKTKFQPVWVDDVARAVLACILNQKTAGKIYELGGPQVYSFRELLRYLAEVTGKRRALMPIPFPVAKLMGSAAQLLPSPMLTYDQVRLLQRDNVCRGELPGFAELGIEPAALESIVPTYLAYRNQAA